MRKNASILFFALLLWSAEAYGQKTEPRLGIAIKPIIPSGLFDNQSLEITKNNVDFSIQPKPGFAGGVVLRKDLPYRLSFETGVYYIRRNYDLTVSDSGVITQNNFRFVNYEIPLAGLIYIRLSENAYLNTAFGVSLDFFPNDIYKVSERLEQEAYRNYWVLPGLIADVGAEYRTESKGIFYFGGSYHRMLLKMAYAEIAYTRNKIVDVATPLSGHYFAFNLRYYFPTQRTEPVDFF